MDRDLKSKLEIENELLSEKDLAGVSGGSISQDMYSHLQKLIYKEEEFLCEDCGKKYHDHYDKGICWDCRWKRAREGVVPDAGEKNTSTR